MHMMKVASETNRATVSKINNNFFPAKQMLASKFDGLVDTFNKKIHK